MTFFDIFIIGALGSSVVFGLFRGFVKEVISVVTWIVAIWAAFTFSTSLAPKIVPYIPFINDLPMTKSLIVQAMLAGSIIFFGVLLLGALVNHLFSMAVYKSGMTTTDRLLGMLFGLIRGILIVSLITLFLGKSELVQQERWWINSKFRSPAQKTGEFIQKIMPDKLKQFLPAEDSEAEAFEPMDETASLNMLKDIADSTFAESSTEPNDEETDSEGN